MAHLDRAAILAAQDLGFEDIDVPEWGGTVRVYALSVTQREELALLMVDMSESVRASAKRGKDDGDFEIKLDMKRLAQSKAQVVVWSAADADGNRLFTQKDIDAVGLKSPAVVERLYDKAMDLSGTRELMTGDIAKN